ncbi:MAG: hypothetical protein LBE09_08200 [Christensenellaceae bacterium]|jgi:hypothetical protein|nr:hypothetical protein [Christensenellaceae bacterium]
MSQNKYKSYFDIDSEFTKTVREENFLDLPDRWLNFYPHPKFLELLSDINRVVSRTVKGLSVWVEGPFGTGKTFALLTLKKILDTSIDNVEKYFTKYNLSKDLLAKYKTLKSEPVLTAYRRASGTITCFRDLIIAMQESILGVIKEKNLVGGECALKEAGIRWLSDPDNKVLFQAKIKKDKHARLGSKTVDSIIDELNKFEDAKDIAELIAKCDELGRENDLLVFRPEPKEFAEWVRRIIEQNGISAFIFIWDEFTEFFQNNLNKLTDFQEYIVGLSDFNFFFVPVTHVSEGLFADTDTDKKKILDRFIKPRIRFELPDSIAFSLIKQALKKNPDKEDEWAKYASDMNDSITEARKRVGVAVGATDETMKGILPLHPYAGLVLKYLAEKFQSNQRSMFDFIVSDSGNIRAFQYFIDNFGPCDSEPYMTVNYLWDFFYKQCDADLPPDIKKILNAHNRVNAKNLGSNEQIVFKTILIMIATSRSVNDEKELLKPNAQNLELAFEGTDLSGASSINIAKRLVEQHLLYERDIVGGGKIYSVAMEAVDESAVSEIVEKLCRTKTETLVTDAKLGDIIQCNPPLKPSIRNRFEFVNVTVDTIQKETNGIINRAMYGTNSINKIPVFLCFARDEKEHSALYKKIQSCNNQAIPNGGNPIVFIDMARTPMTETRWKSYLENKARSQYLSSKNQKESDEANKLAEFELDAWKKAITSSSFELWYAPLYKGGELVRNLNDMMGIFNAINKNLYKYAPETWCDVIDNMYDDKQIKQGALLGAKEETGGTYKNPAKPIEKAIGFAWKNPRYWEQKPTAPISRIKEFVDKTIKEDIALHAQSGIGELFRKLQDKPYGFTSCNLCAFVLGFLLKEYAQNEGEYYYSDGDVDEVMKPEKICDMVKEAFQNAVNPPLRAKEKYIKEKSPEEKQFSQGTAKIFNIAEKECFVGKIREQLRTKLRSYVFPIWTLKEISDDATVHEVIEQYLGVVNNKNYNGGAMNETEIVKTIGKTFIDRPEIVMTLQALISKDNCHAGMMKYLSVYQAGLLPTICEKLRFDTQYLDTLKRKFEVEAATWVWNKQTVDTLIDVVICEYQVIEQSQKFAVKPAKPIDISSAWRAYLEDIKVSYEAAKAYIEGGDLFEFLVKIKGLTEISDIKAFLALLQSGGDEFRSFINSEKELFKKIAGPWTDDLTDEQIGEVYLRIGNGHFGDDKSTYKRMIQSEVDAYRSALGSVKLRAFWKCKTETDTPWKWSEKFSTPILALVPQNEITDAKKYFGIVNSKNPQNTDAEKALSYLKSIKWWDDLASAEKRDAAFATSIVGEYSVILTAQKVRELLNKHLTDGAYYWYSNDQARMKIKELAQADYDTKFIDKAISIVDQITDAEIKDYLKRLIKSKMEVGIEIISDNK